MEDYTLPFWIYLCVLTVFIGGAMKKILASHLSTAPTLVAWLGATVLVERLWAFCLPAVLLLVLLGLACCIYLAARTRPPPAALPAHGKAVFITGKSHSGVSDWKKSGVCTFILRWRVSAGDLLCLSGLNWRVSKVWKMILTHEGALNHRKHQEWRDSTSLSVRLAKSIHFLKTTSSHSLHQQNNFFLKLETLLPFIKTRQQRVQICSRICRRDVDL